MAYITHLYKVPEVIHQTCKRPIKTYFAHAYATRMQTSICSYAYYIILLCAFFVKFRTCYDYLITVFVFLFMTRVTVGGWVPAIMT